MAMTDFQRLMARVSAVEAGMRTLGSNDRTIASGMQRINKRLAMDDGLDLEQRIDPGPLHSFTGPHRRGRSGAIPDMGQAGLQRLRDDPWMSGSIAGRSVPFIGTGNLLLDPAFEHVPDSTIAIGTSYTQLGPFWEEKYVATGAAAANRDVLGDPYRRVSTNSAAGYSSSALLKQVVSWTGTGATGTVTLYLRNDAVSDFTPADNPQARFVVAGCRVMVEPFATAGLGDPPESATMWAEIVDASDTVLATGDTVDLVQVSDDHSFPTVFVALEDPELDGSVVYSMRVVIEVVSGARSGDVGIEASLAEPILSPSDSGSLMAFQPSLGAWVPAHYTPTMGWVALTASENSFAPPQNGQMVVIAPDAAWSIRGIMEPNEPWEYHRFYYNDSSTDSITLVHASGSAGAATQRIYGNNAADVVIRPYGCVELRYFGEADGSEQRWRVLSER